MTQSKTMLGYGLGIALALSLALPAIFGVSHSASAADPSAVNQYFNAGGTQTGSEFAASAGLKEGDLVGSIGKIISLAMGFLGMIAVLIILLGGFKWMTSGGSDEKVKKAKALIFQGIIGLVIILSAYAIATFVISTIVSSTLPA